VKNLSEIEQRKENILKNNKITEELIELDKSLVFISTTLKMQKIKLFQGFKDFLKDQA
jgi:hypothetical protein